MLLSLKKMLSGKKKTAWSVVSNSFVVKITRLSQLAHFKKFRLIDLISIHGNIVVVRKKFKIPALQGPVTLTWEEGGSVRQGAAMLCTTKCTQIGKLYPV
jgi:hypothetical protein